MVPSVLPLRSAAFSAHPLTWACLRPCTSMCRSFFRAPADMGQRKRADTGSWRFQPHGPLESFQPLLQCPDRCRWWHRGFCTRLSRLRSEILCRGRTGGYQKIRVPQRNTAPVPRRPEAETGRRAVPPEQVPPRPTGNGRQSGRRRPRRAGAIRKEIRNSRIGPKYRLLSVLL